MTASASDSSTIYTSFIGWISWFFGYDSSTPNTLPERSIFCTGKWRDNSDAVSALELQLKRSVTVVTHDQEAEWQAKFAHKLMVEQGYVDQYPDHLLYLYLGAGRGSTQFNSTECRG